MVGDQDGATPLCVASHQGHADVVQKLLEAKADANKAKEVGLFDVRDGGRVVRL